MENAYISMLLSGLGEAVQALPFFILILAFVFVSYLLDGRFGTKKRRGWRSSNWQNRSNWQLHGNRLRSFQPANKVPDAADQLRTVMRADFKAQRLLNKSEARLFKMIDKWVIEMRPGWQVMAQVSLGEILRCEDKDAYLCINSKRVDLLIVDDECKPIHAIEYQGGGHFKGAHHTAARDAVKKEALRRAGIGYLEVNAGDTPAELRRVIEKLIGKAD